MEKIVLLLNVVSIWTWIIGTLLRHIIDVNILSVITANGVEMLCCKCNNIISKVW